LIEVSNDKELSKPLVNAVIALAIETASKGYGALVFCSSRAGAERDAELISRAMYDLSQVPVQTVEGRNDLLNDLRSTASGLDQTLEKTIPVGVAFHRKPHARMLEDRLTPQMLA
jgi:replicative superfamily II helicase